MSSPALADAGVPDMPVPAVPDLTEAATAVLEESGVTQLETLAAVDPSIALPAVPAQKAAAEPVTAGAVAAPPPEPVAEAPARAEPAVIPAPDAPPPAEAAQDSPINVNVSVRVDSPGDNGSVEQENAVSATSDATSAQADPQYQPEPQQYQESIPASAAPEPELAPDPPAAEPAQPDTGSTWNWSWNCGEGAPDIAIPPEVAIQNWTWNWDWNCGEPEPIPPNSNGQKTSQYQPRVTQYRPININISIRINSPGNDGPVKQTNVVQTNVVAIVLTAPALPPVRVEVASAPAGSTQAVVSAIGVESVVSPESPAAFVTRLFTESLEPFAEGDCCLRAERGDLAATPEDPQSVLMPQAPPAEHRAPTESERFRTSVAVTLRLAKASVAAARVARPAPRPAEIRPAPHRPSAPARERITTLSASGFAPLNASDGRLGQLVLLVVAFAFALALADTSRSVAAEARAAGEDPDPPPDHPG